MNFLLHMIGQAHHHTLTEGERPTRRHTLLRRAVLQAAGGHFAEAITCRQQLEGDSPLHHFILGHLHLCSHNFAAAHSAFTQGMSLIDAAAPDALEQGIDGADAHLRAGRYVRAAAEFQNARNTIDNQLAANAGLILATARLQTTLPPAVEIMAPLLSLAKLGDLLLRMLARTHLAANVAQNLRDRDLREDLAPWATTRHNVDHLLQAEFDALQRVCLASPDHAENNYRLGLLARALHRPEAAAEAFTRVINIHPHHVLAAARLAATLVELHRADAALALLAVAFTIPAATLLQYHRLATTAHDHKAFEKTAAALCAAQSYPADRATLKANLAFALGEMGLLDAQLAPWTEPALAT